MTDYLTSREELIEIVCRHTRPDSKHQAEALKMLDMHLSRFSPEIKTIICSRCNRVVKDCVRWTGKGQVVDSWGYTELDAGDLCYRCDEQGYIGDILMPRK